MTLTGREVLLEVLADEGVSHLFGNPGTTELPLVDELAVRPEFEFVLGLQENTVVGMADGYAQATGRPAFVSLHTTSGLGGGLGNLTNARANRTPLVVTAGQQDRRHRLADPMLSGDLVGMARPVSKWQHEVSRVGDLGLILRRAFKDAASAPTGPVFVSLPMDVLDESTDESVPKRSEWPRLGIAADLDECARLLLQAAPDRVALVVSEEAATAESFASLITIAETLGSPVYGSPFYSALPFPTDHPLWHGMLDGTAEGSRDTLARYQAVLFVGGQVGFVYQYSPGSAIPTGLDVLHLSGDASLVGRVYPTRLGMVGDVNASLATLALLVTAAADGATARPSLRAVRDMTADRTGEADQVAEQRYDRVPMHPMAAIHALLRALPPSTIVVDEAVTAGAYIRRFHRTAQPGTYFFCRGGGLGWGMPAAVGIKLARPDRPVVCIVGDGAAMYSIQSLWSAAHCSLGILFVIVNNRQYRILRDSLASGDGKSSRSGRFVAMDLDHPAIDYTAIATGLGVTGSVLKTVADIPAATREALASDRPTLLELHVRGG